MNYCYDAASLGAWRPLVPALAELPAPPRRCILHWTGGPAQPNAVDRRHYHYLFTNPDGWVLRGDFRVAQNMRQIAGGDYAAHTGGFNSYSAGFSYCGMYGSSPPRSWGPVPLTESQVTRGLAFVALCCRAWNLDPSNPAHLFTHSEAWTLHRVKGTQNDRKIDIRWLPFLATSINVGDWLRATARAYYDALPAGAL